jgi:hypothetical protein
MDDVKKYVRLGSLFWLLLSASSPPSQAAETDPKRPSKIPYVVQSRVDAIAELRRDDSAEALSAAQAASLSDRLIRVDREARLEVLLHAAGPVDRTEAIQVRELGGEVVLDTAQLRFPDGSSLPGGLGVMQAWIPHDRMAAAAELPWVVAITTAEEGEPDTGSFTSEGTALHAATVAHTNGITGAGVRVGVISDGVAHLAAAQATNDLPANVMVLDTGVNDEGTAMLEIIHDMAPGAQLLFHATGSSVLTHTAAMSDLVAAGADVIAEDIPFDSEPAFQQGMAVSIAQTFACNGVSIRSSAGNRGANHLERVRAVGTGQGPDGNAGPFSGCTIDPVDAVDVDPGAGTAFDVIIPTGGFSITLQWSEPRAIFPTAGAGGFTDLDLYLMDSSGTTCLLESLAFQGLGSGDTIEQIVGTNNGAAVAAKVVVVLYDSLEAVADPLIDLRWRGMGAVDPTTRAGSLNPDANYTGLATSSAAANSGPSGGSTDPGLAPLEGFSSGGPVILESTTVCAGGSYPCPGSSVAGPAPTSRGAPTWTAADGVTVSGAGGFGSGTCPAVNNGDCLFFGTSAAAPHAAGCDALTRQALIVQGVTPTVAQINGLLAGSATDRGTPGFDDEWGAGVLNCGFGTPHMLVLLDRTGSMIAVRSNGRTRCRDALELAVQDVVSFFGTNPGSSVSIWTFAGSAPTDLSGGFVDQATALAVLNSLSPEGCAGSTPLAEAMCAASDELSASFPMNSPASLFLAVSSDGGENNSSGECAGFSSASGPPYDPGSWQQKVRDKLLGQSVALTRFWGAVSLTFGSDFDLETGRAELLGTSDSVFLEDLAVVTGGIYQPVDDGDPLPSPPVGGLIFLNGFESGDTSRWSSTVP